MENNREGMREQVNLSARALSADNLDKLSVTPTIPRAKIQDVQKSLSTDASKAKIVSETDLSSSWLYKTMQASINARFKSPRKSPSMQQMEDIQPVTLQDPNLKPIPVHSSAERTSSCLCYFATMVAISICTVGFLASIAGIIYMEVFASRNITSLHASETQVDLSDVALDSLENHNSIAALEVDTDGSLDGKFVEGTVFEKSSVNEGQSGVMGRFLLTGDPDVAELDQYVNSTEAKIKFRDGQTIIYEVNTNEDRSSDSIENTRSTEQDGFDETEDLNFENEKSSVDDTVNLEKSESLLSNAKEVDDNVVTESVAVSNRKLPDFIFDENLDGKDSEDFKDRKINSEITSAMSLEVEQPTKATEFQTKDFELEISPNFETNDLFFSDKKSVHSEKIGANEGSVSSNWSDLSNTQGSRALHHGGKISSFVDYVDHTVKNENNVDSMVESVPASRESQQVDKVSSFAEYIDHTVTSEHDVNSMVVTVDEPEPEASTDSFSERNGEVPISTELSSFGRFSLPSNVSEKNVLPKSVDIKVSLAEAMKHLHALDTHNKLVTSREKTTGKVVWSKRLKPTVSLKEGTTTEKMSYLQKVRLMLYRQLQ